MKGYIGYIRVSTVKQGTHGVSLLEQKDAILRYAESSGFAITVWLEEMVTAAKQGRPIFNQALKLLRTGKARGIILHKLDRGARNLRDWASIGELSDQGIEVHFVTESLDLQSRGGRLSADIQAVVAADYIRNLREETRKGFYGRLKQGFYPLRAPIGYLDQGKAKAKTIDPVMGPLVRQTFELYATGRHTLISLLAELHRIGLRSRSGTKVSKSALASMLKNTFYIGIMQIHRTGQSFAGLHEPLISQALFERVQAVLSGKYSARTQRHAFQYRRLLSCAACGYSLTGERQKGHIYYRCHWRACKGASIREEAIDVEFGRYLDRLVFTEQEERYAAERILQLREDWSHDRQRTISQANLQLAQIKTRLNRLTDAYLDGGLDKTMFEERKKELLLDQKATEGCIADVAAGNTSFADKLQKIFELAANASLSHQMADTEEKHQMVKILTSNLSVSGKCLSIEPSIAFAPIANRSKIDDCGPNRDELRTFDQFFEGLTALNTTGRLPDLITLNSSLRHCDAIRLHCISDASLPER
jgi:DNA invertase Pin-like site-specific DNA recombinase